MDFEKEYKDMVQRARELHESGNALTKQQMEIVCPALAESEDERIRKHLLTHFKNKTKETWCNMPVKSIIAYLEKQKLSAAEEVLIKAGLKPYKDGNQWCILIGDNIQDGICGFGDTIDDALYHLLREAIAYQKEQEPEVFKIPATLSVGMPKTPPAYKLDVKPTEWSEEDEKTISDAYCWLAEYAGFIIGENKEKATMLFDLAKRLKSLRPQPKAKLTLLDENIINAAVAFVEQNNHFNCWRGIDKHAVIKALRSLKPHWKPSEEQMEWLESAVKLSTDKPRIHGIIISLYEQLKRL